MESIRELSSYNIDETNINLDNAESTDDEMSSSSGKMFFARN
jgi:hypothetical protein